MRIIFAGTTNFSAQHLNALIHASYKIIAILTQKYLPTIYDQLIYEKNIQEIAQKNQLPLFQPNSLQRTDIIKKIKFFNPDIMVVVSYGLIIPKTILEIPSLGCINVHGSLLPRWRGAAPIQRAIEAGDTETGITIIQMDNEIDTGNILYKHTCAIKDNETSLSLFKKLSNIGIIGLLQTLSTISEGTHTTIPQNNNFSTYAKKIKKSEAKINWNLSAIQLERQIRAFNPWPTSFFKQNEKRIKVWEAKINDLKNTEKHIKPGTILSINKSGLTVTTGCGSLTLTRVQEEGKKIISISELLNSKKHWFTVGSILNDHY